MYDIREEDQDAARRATLCTHVRAYACACACVCVQVCRVVQCVERYSEATRGATRAVATAKGLQIGTSGECVTLAIVQATISVVSYRATTQSYATQTYPEGQQPSGTRRRRSAPTKR